MMITETILLERIGPLLIEHFFFDQSEVEELLYFYNEQYPEEVAID